jgi:hypothetical protein
MKKNLTQSERVKLTRSNALPVDHLVRDKKSASDKKQVRVSRFSLLMCHEPMTPAGTRSPKNR